MTTDSETSDDAMRLVDRVRQLTRYHPPVSDSLLLTPVYDSDRYMYMFRRVKFTHLRNSAYVSFIIFNKYQIGTYILCIILGPCNSKSKP